MARFLKVAGEVTRDGFAILFLMKDFLMLSDREKGDSWRVKFRLENLT